MKKLLILLGTALFLNSCIGEDVINDLQAQIDALKQTEIADIKTQVANIEATLPKLEAADTELKGYIETLQKQAEALQAAIDATDGKLTELSGKSEDSGKLMESHKKEVTDMIETINGSLTQLKDKDLQIEKSIGELREYVDNELSKNKDWAKALSRLLTNTTPWLRMLPE